MVSEPTPTTSPARGTTPVGGSASAGPRPSRSGPGRHRRPAVYWLGAFPHRLSKPWRRQGTPERFGRDPAIRKARAEIARHPHTALRTLAETGHPPGGRPGAVRSGGTVTGQPPADFADLLRQLRKDARLTQEELAEDGRGQPADDPGSRRAAATGPRTSPPRRRLAGALSLTGQARALFVQAAAGRAPGRRGPGRRAGRTAPPRSRPRRAPARPAAPRRCRGSCPPTSAPSPAGPANWPSWTPCCPRPRSRAGRRARW